MTIEFKYFGLILHRLEDNGFSLGVNPVWFHKHGGKIHYHFLLDLFFWYIEVRIGNDEADNNND